MADIQNWKSVFLWVPTHCVVLCEYKRKVGERKMIHQGKRVLLWILSMRRLLGASKPLYLCPAKTNKINTYIIQLITFPSKLLIYLISVTRIPDSQYLRTGFFSPNEVMPPSSPLQYDFLPLLAGLSSLLTPIPPSVFHEGHFRREPQPYK